MRLTPAIKGIITTGIMIVIVLILYKNINTSNPALQYLVYITYASGIIWTLLIHSKSSAFTGKFGDLFNQGFKCFVVVTLLMAIFYGVFNYQHPEFAEESAKAYKAQLEQQVVKNERLPTAVDSEVTTYKKQYTLKLVSGAIFGYLLIGTAVTAAVSAILTRRKQ